MTDWRLDIVELNGSWGVTDSSGPVRVFPSLRAAMAEARGIAEDRVSSGSRVEIYSWSNGREHKVFDSASKR